MQEEAPKKTLEEAVAENIVTPYGRQRLLYSMVQPLRLLLDYRQNSFDYTQERDPDLAPEKRAAIYARRREDFETHHVIVRVFEDLSVLMEAPEKDGLYQEVLQLMQDYRSLYIRSAFAVPLFSKAVDEKLRALWADDSLAGVNDRDAEPPV